MIAELRKKYGFKTILVGKVFVILFPNYRNIRMK